MKPRIVLASASPRRALILAALGIPFRIVVSRVDETFLPGEEPGEATQRVARAKAEAAVSDEGLPVLGADTTVVCQGRVLGKPASPREAAEMLRSLAGRSHEVVSGVCLLREGVAHCGVERTAVTFEAMTETEIAWYVATGEPLDKAGGYHIDGKGALFVAGVAGSSSNVAGLPVRLVYRLAREAGVDLLG